MKKFFSYFRWWVIFLAMAVIVGMLSAPVHAGDLPAGYIGRVLNNTPNTWQVYTFNYTPTISGSQFVMLTFRQDPAYWYVDNVSVKAAGSSTNLLVNGDMTTGGSLQVQTSNYGQMSINAPTAWGVTYQSGVYPSAAGTWYNGQWVDGAVGSYDGIYQGINMTAGTTYQISFSVMGNHSATTTTTGWQLAVYAGTCDNVGLTPTSCTLPAASGFQTVATPGVTYTAGCTTNCPVPPPSTPALAGGATADPFSASATNTTKLTTFTNRVSADSKVTIEQIGDSNTIVVSQSGTKDNYAKYVGNGSSNNITITQSGTNQTVANYTDLRVTGSFNTVDITQQSTGGTKGAFVTVSNNSNTVNIQQKDAGSHYVEMNLSGGSKTVDVLQQGSAAHMANITMTGLSTTLSLTQQGSTQQFYSITHNCATVGGCGTITATQGQ